MLKYGVRDSCCKSKEIKGILVLQVRCLISGCCTRIELYAGANQAEQSVPDAFAHQFQFLGLSVMGHTCYRYHS